ncbi:MAG: trigger factor [Candidatus Magasanikbacteria bacterium]|nr:trigger factor [Candidatus Magasanikbacteria bacterium]
MPYELKKLEKSEVELTITVTPPEYQHDLEHAAKHLSEVAAIKGFRPGAAPYDIVKQQVGEQKILEAALEEVVHKNFYKAIDSEKLQTVGMPMITIEKLASGNDIVFKAKVALLPKIKLADFGKIKVETKKIEVGDREIAATLYDLQKMRMKEETKNGAATKEDKIVVDLDMFIDKVPVEGGQAKGHQVYLSEEHYIPGFAEQLINLKKDDEKEFSLKFPKEHYQKHLAGKEVDIKVKAKDIFSLELPALNDDFAKSLGQNDIETLKSLIQENLKHEAEHKESQRLEVAILEQLVEKSEFAEIPEVLIKSEKQKMFNELKHDLEHRGIEMEKYLQDLKKSEEEIYRDFEEGALKRVKASLVAREVAIENKIEVDKDELNKEIDLIKATYGNDPKVEENLKRPEVLDTIARTVQNRKVVEFLKKQIIK